MRSGDTRSFAAATILSVSMAISSAGAQGPPGGMMGGPGGPSLVMSEAVQDDLGLSEKQKAQLKKVEASLRQKGRATLAVAADGGDDGGLEPGEMREAMGALGREHHAAVAKVLDKNQKARLAQIEMRREGLLAVAKPDVASKIKLAPAQAKKVKAIVAEMRQAQFRAMPRPPGVDGPPTAVPPADQDAAPSKGKRAAPKKKRAARAGDAPAVGDMPADGGDLGPPGGFLFGGPPGGMPDFNSEEFKEQLAKMMEAEKNSREAAIAKIGEVLTNEQADAFDKLLGKPFDFSKLEAGPPKVEETPKAGEEATKKEATKMEPPAKSQPKPKSPKADGQ